jgi:hypothetical protein
MEALKRQVSRAYRRLLFQNFLRLIPWCWTATLAMALVLICIDKFWPMGVLAWQWGAGALAAGVLAGLIGVSWSRKGPMDAAIELDKRFGLKERVSSTLSLDPTELETDAGKALVDDAVKRVSKLHVPDQFAVQVNGWSLLPLLPAGLAAAVALYIAPIGNTKLAETKAQQVAKQQVQAEAAKLQQKLAERRKIAEERGLKDLEKLFAEMEKGTKDINKAPDANPKESMAKLNDLAEQLEKKRTQMGGLEEMKQQLDKQLKGMNQGPGEKFAKSLKNGDFKQAIQEIKKLQESLKSGELNDEQKAQLAEQLQKMEQKLNELAQANKDLQQQLKKQIEQKKAAGEMQEADKLQQQLSKLQQQDQNMQKMQEMAQKMGEMAQCLQQGNSEKCAQLMEAVQAQMAEVAQQAEEMEMLEQAMAQIEDAKQAMAVAEQMMDGGMGGDEFGMGDAEFGDPGMGLGRGQGRGDRPEEEDDTGFYDSTVKQKVGRGSVQIQDFVEGPNVKGDAIQQVETEFQEAKKQSGDPLTGVRLPRDYRDHTKGYFDALREGK